MKALFALIFALIFSPVTVGATEDQAEAPIDVGMSPIVYFSFDDHILFDEGPYRLTGKRFGDELEIKPDRMGNALFVGGTEDWIDVPLDPRIDLDGGASAEVWFRREDWINPYWGGSGFMTLFSVATDLGLTGTTSQCPTAPPWALLSSMTYYNKEADETDVVRVYTEPNTVPAEKWMHAAVTYDPEEALLVLYLDGYEVDRSYGVPPQAFSWRKIRIGTWHKANQAFRGLLDELKVYDYVRSADDILIESSWK